MTRKLLSLILILSLLCCGLPVNTLAAGDGAVPEREEPLPLPFEAPAPMEAETALSVPGENILLAEEQDSTIYLYQGVKWLNNITGYGLYFTLTDPEADLSDRCYLQVRDSANNLVAQPSRTVGLNLTGWSSERREYQIIFYETLVFDPPLAAGVYSFKLFDAESGAVYDVEKTLTVVDSGIIFDRLNVEDLHYGDTQCEVWFTGYGNAKYEDLTAVRLEIVRVPYDGSEETVVARSAGELGRRLYFGEGNGIPTFQGYTRLTCLPGESFREEDRRYYLRGSFQGNGLSVYFPPSESVYVRRQTAQIGSILLEDAGASVLKVKLKDHDPDTVYRLRAEMGSSEFPLYLDEWEGKAGPSGEISFPLRLNGQTAPLSMLPLTRYGTLFIRVDLDAPEAGPSGETEYHVVSSETFEWELKNGSALRFSPSIASAGQTSVPFVLEGLGGWDEPLQTSGAVVTLRDPSGREAGRCTDLRLEPGKDRATGVIALDQPLTPGHGGYLAMVNGVAVSWLSPTDYLQTYERSFSFPWGTICANLGKLTVSASFACSTGKGSFRFLRSSDGAAVLTGDTVQGTVQADGLTRFTYSFTSQSAASKLKEGQYYELVFVDSKTKESAYICSGTYTAEKKSFVPGETYLGISWDPSNDRSDRTVIRAEIDLTGLSGAVKTELDAVLRELKLCCEETEETYSVSSVLSGAVSPEDPSVYRAFLAMDGILPRGYYDLRYRGSRISYLFQVGGSYLYSNAYNDNQGAACTGLTADAVYTGEVYRGYDRLSDTPFPMTLIARDRSDIQLLRADPAVLNELCREEGVYLIRIFRNGKYLGDVEYTVTGRQKPFPVLMDSDWNFIHGNVIREDSFRVETKNHGDYNYIRLTEDPNDPSREFFLFTQSDYETWYFGTRQYINEWDWEIVPGEPGPRTLYIEYSRTGVPGAADNVAYALDLLYLPQNASDPDLGLEAEEEFTFDEEDLVYRLEASTSTPLARVWAELSDENGNTVTRELKYEGPAQASSRSGEERSLFVLELAPYEDLSGPLFDFEDHEAVWGDDLTVADVTQVRIFATTCHDVEEAIPDSRDKLLEDVELALSHILLKDLPVDGSALFGGSFSFDGLAPPWESVEAELESVDGSFSCSRVQDSSSKGAFTFSFDDLSTGEYLLTVTCGTLTTAPEVFRINVDGDAPEFSQDGPGLRRSVENGTSLLVWSCDDADGDLDRFEVYREFDGTPLAVIRPNSGGVYAFRPEDDGDEDIFYVVAVDLRGNRNREYCQEDASILDEGCLPGVLILPGEISETGASVDLFGNSEDDQEMYCILAAYDGNGRMLSSKTEDLELACAGAAAVSVKLDSRAVLLKAFLLEKGTNAPKQDAWSLDLTA